MLRNFVNEISRNKILLLRKFKFIYCGMKTKDVSKNKVLIAANIEKNFLYIKTEGIFLRFTILFHNAPIIQLQETQSINHQFQQPQNRSVILKQKKKIQHKLQLDVAFSI